jgi:dTMP kinase
VFITIEGGEGAGKSTQIQNITGWLETHGHEVICTRQPGGTVISEQIREILLNRDHHQQCPTTELLLAFAARAQLLKEVIRPGLAAEKVIVCDRFTDASYAYQGGGRGLPAGDIATLEQLVHGDLQPNLTLLLDLPVEAGLRRAAGRGAPDRFETESLAFFERVRAVYLSRASADPDRFALIDASLDEDAVWLQIRAVLESRLT